MKNKEPIILAVVIFFTLVTYYLVEPYAHHVMHKQVAIENYEYNDLPAITKTGNAANGKDLVMGAGACTGCHSIESAGIAASMDPVSAAAAYGVNPPDLSNAGVVYEAKFLAALIKDPAKALKVEHKFTADSGKSHPMMSFGGAGGDIDQEIADMVAYLQSIAISQDELTPAMAFENACSRCHSVDYLNSTQLGNKPKFKTEIDALKYELQVLEYQDSIKAYMGKTPPDLSMQISARGEHRFRAFVENPQSYLEGTAMPRVGVNADSMDKIIEHMKDSADAKREQRDSVGKTVMIYIVIFAIFALLWKKQVWKDLH